MSAGAAKLEVSGLQKRFGGLTAVKDVSFSVHAGENSRAHRAEWIGQVDGDEIDPRRRAARCGIGSGRWP